MFAIAFLLMIGAGAGAQTNPGSTTTPPATTSTPAAAAAANARLDQYMQLWEKEMQKIQTLSAVINRLDKDKSFGTTTKLTGNAQYMKSGTAAPILNFAMLELKQEGKTDIFEKFICTGTYIYQFVPAQKEIRAYPMPRPKPGQVGDDSFLGFLFGMKADEAKKRYNLTMGKEDKWYIYVDVVPRHPADRKDFQRARIVLNRDSYLPRQLWFEAPNGNEVTWDIPTLKAGVPLDRRVFDAPKPPAGWKFSVINPDSTPTNPTNGSTPTPVAPKVVRPNKN